MSEFLSSADSVNVRESQTYADQLSDKREKAFVLFVMGQATFAIGRGGVRPPEAPVDFMYLAEIARSAYAKKNLLQEILSGDVDNVLWGESKERGSI
ncbi:MAG TPA: hypothetical protein VIE67_05845 [Rudaea sp.]|jgi:hypothetical protein|uniref:hypothetical protein n=1 Tax=Rudaea sp. TaxID=2136325 RepID=UPI002F94D40D